MDSLTLRVCDDPAAWDGFVDASPQGSVFCRTAMLDALDVDYRLWWVEERGCPRAGFVLLLDEAGQPRPAPHPFTLYHGVLFDRASREQPVHERAKRGLELLEFALAGLEGHYRTLSFCLHPRFEDLRAFSWFHYHEPARGRFAIELAYTGWIDLTPFPSFDAYLQTVRPTRRNEYRQAVKKGLTVEPSDDLDLLDRLHALTFERQDLRRDETESRLVRRLAAAALRHGLGELLVCREPGGQAASATLFLYGNDMGNYLFGANHPEHRRTSSGIFLLLENIRRCMERGVTTVDVLGVNSPNRGDFKTSFNARPVPYFVATWPGQVP